MSTSLRTIPADELSTATAEEIYNFGRRERIPRAHLRVSNGLDVDITLEFELTDLKDPEFNRPIIPNFWGTEFLGRPLYRSPGGLTDNGSTTTVSVGETDTRIMDVRWARIKAKMTPAADPSSGEITLVFVE